MDRDTMELLETEVAFDAAERPDVLILACGAIAREVLAVIELNGWTHVDVRCLPAKLHSTPEKIAGAVDAKLTELKGQLREHLRRLRRLRHGRRAGHCVESTQCRAAAGRALLRLPRRQRRVGRDAGGGARHLLPDRFPRAPLRVAGRAAVQARHAPRAAADDVRQLQAAHLPGPDRQRRPAAARPGGGSVPRARVRGAAHRLRRAAAVARPVRRT